MFAHYDIYQLWLNIVPTNTMLLSHKSRSGMVLGLSLAILHMIFFAVELFSGKFEKKSVRYSVRKFVNQSDIPWDEIFSFVPPGIKSCEELFIGEDKSRPFGDTFYHKSTYFRKYLKSEYVGAREKHSNVWRYSEEAMVLYTLGTQPHVRTICETGFNAGHSAYIWLRSNPNITVITFDIGHYKYSREMAKIIKRRFGDHFTITWGDSLVTLPRFRKEHPDILCDVIFIDGGETYDVVQSDIANFLLMADSRSVIILNNYPPRRPETRVGKLWEAAKYRGDITEIFRCDYQPRRDHGFSVGRVEPQANNHLDQ